MRSAGLFFVFLGVLCGSDSLAQAPIERRVPETTLKVQTRLVGVAVNREYAGASTELADGDELALLPPVSGGAGWHGEVRGEGRGANG